MKPPQQVAYEVYVQELGSKTAPPWEELSKKIKDAWLAAVLAAGAVQNEEGEPT